MHKMVTAFGSESRPPKADAYSQKTKETEQICVDVDLHMDQAPVPRLHVIFSAALNMGQS